MAEAALPLDEPLERDIVVVGASAGGVEALATLAAGLDPDFRGTMFVVLHLPEGGRSVLAGILHRAGPLDAVVARDREPFEPGTIVVAPPSHHLLVERDHVRVVRGPKINGHRPAVDVLFHSAARTHADRVVGVVLSGARDDGAFGLRAIKRRGGAAIVQSDALHPGMPTSAMASVEVDCAVPLREIPDALTMLMTTREEAPVNADSPAESDLEAGFDLGQLREVPGDPSGFTCPECGGALWELEDDGLRGYVCHVGHTFSADSLLEEHGETVERALWTAVRILEERRALVLRLAERMLQQGHKKSAGHFLERAEEAGRHAETIRTLIERPATAEGTGPDIESGRAA